MLAHVGLDLRVRVPLFAVALVAADMEVGVGKERRHLPQKLIEKLERAFARRVHGRVHDAPAVRNLVRARAAGQLWIPYEPRRGVAGHIEFGNHADAAIVRVLDDVCDLLLRVVETVRALFLKKRIDLAFDWETLVIREMPVEDIELHRFHAVQVALDHVDRLEVAAGINHQAAPREARLVVDGDRRRGETLRGDVHQLQKCLQAVQHAERIGGRQLDACLADTFK